MSYTEHSTNYSTNHSTDGSGVTQPSTMICQPHFERTGKQVPATHGNMCEHCFRGDAITHREEVGLGSVTPLNMAQRVQSLESRLRKLNDEVVSLRSVQHAILRQKWESKPERKAKPITTLDIDSLVAAAFKLDPADLYYHSNSKSFVVPRQIAMYLWCKAAGFSLNQVGRRFGLHHTTVMYAVKRVEDRMESERSVRLLVSTVLQKFQKAA